MRDDTICPACGSINDFASSYLGMLCGCEHHRCRWCGAQFFVDEVEPEVIAEHGLIMDCSPINIVEPILMPDDEEDL